nr:hypothetical protein GCM10020092_090130 [Actinoplanes digitatis]
MPPIEPQVVAIDAPAASKQSAGDSQPPMPALTVGHDYTTGEPVSLALESLRKHVAIFAGSGSGKTVLIRRLIEECALQGVSAIVLDPNNDLARLGDPWPTPPTAWQPGDARKAADYIAGTEVVVWTPRRETGRPLSFQPLPDFKSALDDPDEFNEAVDSAVAALIPRARLDSRATKAHLGLAVLRRAVEHYGRRGGGTLRGLIETLAELPTGVSELDSAEKNRQRSGPDSHRVDRQRPDVRRRQHAAGSGNPAYTVQRETRPYLGDQPDRPTIRRHATEFRQSVGDGAVRIHQEAPGRRSAIARAVHHG